MKKQSFTPFITLGKEDLANLTIEVKETIAFGLVEPFTRKIFTTAELWNIQRQAKSRTQRRFL